MITKIAEIKTFQEDFDQRLVIEGSTKPLSFTGNCLSGELGEFFEAIEDGSFEKIEEELTDLFVYAVIASNTAKMMPMLPKLSLPSVVGADVANVAWEMVKAVGRFSEAAKKLERAQDSQNGNEGMRERKMLDALDKLFSTLTWAADVLGIDLALAYYKKMAVNEKSSIKYKG